jgi:hypothetical protein
MTKLDHMAVADAAEKLDEVLARGQALSDPNMLARHMTCTEAEAFADLLRALGLDHHADDLIHVHEETDEYGDLHYSGE